LKLCFKAALALARVRFKPFKTAKPALRASGSAMSMQEKAS